MINGSFSHASDKIHQKLTIYFHFPTCLQQLKIGFIINLFSGSDLKHEFELLKC